jgi:hypothetical protein
LGGFVYYLVLFLALGAALGMAWGEWRRARREQDRRLLLSMVGLIGLRLGYAIAVLTVSGRGVVPAAVLPPLERFVDAASICLLGWGFVAPGKPEARTWHLAFAVGSLTALAAAVGSAIAWVVQASGQPALNYSTSWQAVAWSVFELVLIILASLAVLGNRREGAGAFLGAMVVLALGTIWQIVDPAAVPHAPAWERLSNLIAYPLVAAAVYQTIVTGLRREVNELQGISQASLQQVSSLLTLLEASQQISASPDLATVVDSGARGIGRVLNADQCAIALPDDGKPGILRLAAVYSQEGQRPERAPTFSLENQLAVQKALRRKEAVTVVDSNVQLQGLFELLGAKEIGPLLVQPLLVDGEAIGVVLVGNSRSRRAFTPHDIKLCQSLVDQVADTLRNIRRFEAAQDRIRKLDRSPGPDSDPLEPHGSPLQEAGVGPRAENAAVPPPGDGL